MTHKPIHTYGKRALRNRKPTSNTAAGPRRDSTDDASSTEPESEARCDDAVPSVTVQECTGLPSPAAASTSTHARPASFVVPEVVIYPDKHKKHSLKLSSPQHTRNTSSVKSRDRSNISPSFAKADASHLCQVETDLKGKGRMRETLGSGNESSDDLRMISSSTEEESDCVYVATWSQHPLYLKRTVETDESEDDLPNSEALATPRRTTKRGRFQPCGTADLEVRDARKAPRESPRTRRKNLPLDKHTSSLPDNVPPLRKHDSIDSLFDGLLEDDQPASRNPSHRPSTLSEQSRISFHSQMIGRPENREVPTSFLSHAPSAPASPVRLRRPASSNMASPQVSSNGSDGSDVPKNTLVDEGLDLPTFPMHSCANSPESAKWGKKTTTPLAQKPPDPFVIPSIIDASGVQGRENSPHLRNGPSSDESLDSGIIDQEERDIVIHSRLHLRSAGESRRFEDSMHYLLDGLALGETAAVHRASSVDILLRLENEDFIRKLKVYDFVPRLYIAFRQVGAGDGDVVLDITLLLFLRAVCTDRSIIESILVASPEHKPDLLSILSSLHERAWLDNDMASAGLSGSKSEKRHLLALREYCIKHEHAIDVSKPIRITSRYVLTKVMTSVCQCLPHPLTALSGADILTSILGTLLEAGKNADLSPHPRVDAAQLAASLELLYILSADLTSNTVEAERLAEAGSHLLLNALGKIVRIGASSMTRARALEEDEDTVGLVYSLKILSNLVEAGLLPEARIETCRSLSASLMDCIDSVWTLHASSSAKMEGLAQHSNAIASHAAEVLLVALSLLQTMLEGSASTRTVYQESEIQSRSHSVAEAEGTPRISSSALICRIFLAAMAEESSVRVKHTLNCNITLTVLLPQSEAQVIAGYASLIVIYGSFSNVAVQRSVVQIIQTSEKSLRFLRNAVHELLRLHAQADELGVDATQTSAGDLKSMQTRLDAALSVRDSKS